MDIYLLLACAETEGQLNFLKKRLIILLQKEHKNSRKYQSLQYAYRQASNRIHSIPWRARDIRWYDEVHPKTPNNDGRSVVNKAF